MWLTLIVATAASFDAMKLKHRLGRRWFLDLERVPKGTDSDGTHGIEGCSLPGGKSTRIVASRKEISDGDILQGSVFSLSDLPHTGA